MTVAAKPGRREGGGTLDSRTRDLVLMEGGATRAAAVATWALVRLKGMCCLVWRHCVVVRLTASECVLV